MTVLSPHYCSFRLLQEHLGHQSIVTTMRYRKVSGEEQKEWYEKLWQGDKANG